MTNQSGHEPRPHRDSTVSGAHLPAIVAHRGASKRAPENSLAAFRLAWEEEADFIEGDFRLTADDEIICLHDETTKRTAPDQKNLHVQKSTMEDLKKLDIGSHIHDSFAGATFPTLEQVCSTIPPGRGIYIEIKDTRPRIVEVLRNRLEPIAIEPQLLRIISFHPEIIEHASRLLPEIRSYLLYEPRQADRLTAPHRLRRKLIDKAKSIGATGLDICRTSPITAELKSDLHQAKLELHVWTVNEINDAIRLAAIGVDSLTTDTPGKIKKELNAWRCTS